MRRLGALLLALAMTLLARAQVLSQPYQAELVVLDVQRDGSVIVTHVIRVAEEQVLVSVRALAKPLEPVIAVGKDVYDVEVKEVNGTYLIRVIAPDVGLVNVTYVSDQLTRMVAPNLWVLNFTSDAETVIVLPIGAIPVKVPEGFLELSERGGRYVIAVPAGAHEVRWILRVKPPILVAKASLRAVSAPREVKSEGELVVEVEVANVGNVTGTFFVRVLRMPERSLVSAADVTLGAGESTKVEFKLHAPRVDRNSTLNLRVICGQGESVHDEVEVSVLVYVSPKRWYGLELAAVAAVAVAAAAAAVALARRRGGRSERPLSEVDYKLIRYLRSRGGVALQRDIVRDLNLPKTTVHRHLRKLERYGIVEIRKVGNLNQVRLTSSA